MTREQIGLVALTLRVRFGPVALGTERLEPLLPKALRKSLNVIPLKRRALPVAQGATVVVLLKQLGLLFPSEVDTLSLSQQPL